MNVGAVPDAGRQIKVISLLLAEIYDHYVFNPPRGASEDEEDDDAQGYEGATVIDTKKGFYSGACEQVILLDFASLYPSLARAYRVCPSRYVRQNVPEEVAASQLPGVVVATHHVSDTETVLLATPYPDPGKPYFYGILQKLLDERAAVRKLIKTEPDPAKRAILNARQLAKKVGANSAYGLLGCKKGYMPLPQLAAVITYQGRQALQFSQHLAETKYGARTVAGGELMLVMYTYGCFIHISHISGLLIARTHADTDSIMIILPPQPGVPTPAIPDEEWKAQRMKHVFQHGGAIGDDISSQLPSELEFELEGVMFPAAFYGKKRYAAMIYVKPEHPKELKMRGVCAIRNDWSILTKTASTTVLRMAIRENNAEGALAYLRDLLCKMRDGLLPMSMFVVSKQLKTLSPKTVSAHVALCQRLIRDGRKDEVPVLGTKVSYVIVRGHDDLSEASRLPEDVTVDQLDLKYYMTRQLLKPLTELLGPMIRGGEKTLQKLLLKDMDQHRQRSIYEMFGLETPPELILRPDATSTVEATQARASPLRSQTLYEVLNVQQPENKRKAAGAAPVKKAKKSRKQKPPSVATFFAMSAP
jgi:DNA polymerase elongation subunit (family B)